MVFNNETQLKNYILSHSKNAVEEAQQKIYDVIDKFLQRYYDEYSPTLYVRTGQLLRSLVKSEIKPIKDGWEAEVYFDLDSLDYSFKSLQGVGGWNNTYHRNNWTHENDIAIFEMSAHGSHGGFIGGTAVWDEPLEILKNETYKYLKQALINNKIPVK